MDYTKIEVLLDKYLDGRTSIEEERILFEYFTNTKDIPAEFVYAKGIFSYVKEEKKIHFSKQQNINKHKMKIVLAGIAASVTILIGVFFLLQQPESEIVAITQKNQTTSAKKIILEDGNIVWLNKNTTITYFNKTNPYYNIIDIKGEAYFEILNPKIFNYQVLAHNAMIQIESPSSFNVKAFETSESIDITVNSGAITVLGGSHEGGLGLLVTQGNYCSVHKTRNLAFSSVNKNDNYLAWKTGKLVFERLPMATVTEVLSEYYNVKIDYENKDLAYCEFSGHFEEKSIEFILDKIKTELNFNIHSSENVITFSGSNCL